MSRLDLVRQLDFGKVDSESEADLDRLFVRTSDFDKFLRDEVWLALGAKGTGKSAIFELFTKFQSTARRLSGNALNHIVIGAGTGFGDLSEIATGDIQLLRDANSNFDHDKLWRLYIAVKAGLALDKSFKVRRGPLKDLLRILRKRRDVRVGPLVTELWELAIGSAPASVTVSAGGATISIKGGRRSLDVVTLLEDVNEALGKKGKKLWLFFDKVDEIWPTDRLERRRALEGLMTASMQIRRTFPNIQPKVLLRTDLWSELDFTNKDHLTDKRIELNWDTAHIVTLLLKRAVSTGSIRLHCENAEPRLIGHEVEELSQDERLNALMAIFPSTAYAGKREAPTADWIVERVTDGRGTVLPRDAIVWAGFSRDFDIAVGTDDDAQVLISREAIRDAFTKTSVVRCESFLAEFPDLREHFQRFSGLNRAKLSRADIDNLMTGLTPSGNELLDRLFEIGIIQPDSGRVLLSKKFEVPRLYRSGLGLAIPGRP